MPNRKNILEGDTITITFANGEQRDLPLAGPGARAWAFVIDWHIRLLAGLICVLIASLAYTGSYEPLAYLSWISLPGLVVYLLYHPVVELLMPGSSPGKHYAKVRIVTLDGRVPGIGAVLIRNVWRLVDSLPLFYIVGMVVCLFDEKYRRLGDKAAGTLMVYTEPVREADDGSRKIRAVTSLLDRWDQLAPATRLELAERLLLKLGHTPASVDPEALRDQLREILASFD